MQCMFIYLGAYAASMKKIKKKYATHETSNYMFTNKPVFRWLTAKRTTNHRDMFVVVVDNDDDDDGDGRKDPYLIRGRLRDFFILFFLYKTMI